MKNWIFAVLALLVGSLAWKSGVGLAEAGTQSVMVSGVVLDPMRTPVAGAVVQVASEGRAPIVSMTTDARGAFSADLPSGIYQVRIQAQGFAAVERRLALTGSIPVRLDVELTLAQLEESVTVTALAGSAAGSNRSATRLDLPLRDIPQAITVVTQERAREQMLNGVGDALRHVPGVSVHQGENNRDQVIMRGNSSSADFFLDGVRDDVQYYRDLYNLERVEALKGPNAMVFGRGGAGGVVNRVSKAASFAPARELTVQAGGFGTRRLTAGFSQPIGGRVAARLDGVVEQSGSFRDFVELKRFGVTPTVTVTPDSRTTVTLRYEFLHDARTADRGVTSFRGRPADVPYNTFYGNPRDSHVRADVHLASGLVQRRVGEWTLRNQTLLGHYDRGYQNYVPGAVMADRASVALSAYNNATVRLNLFNQTDATTVVTTAGVRHRLLVGAEFGRQATDNVRQTGYFNNLTTTIAVPFAAPQTSAPITFRQSATDADNHLTASVAAAYVQDQMEVSRYLQVLAGARLDRFGLSYQNRRTGDSLDRPDTLVSPRLGVVFKPVVQASLYGSYGMSFVPSSGDQFSSLTTVTEQIKPEALRNYELGAKWDVLRSLAVTGAVYLLDRTNTRSVDPNDVTRIIQTGSQRSTGVEIGIDGRVTAAWQLSGGYAYQQARIVRATAAAAAGARVPQVPRHMLSLWSTQRLSSWVSASIGLVQRSEMFAAIDNTVRLAGYLRADAAGFVRLTPRLRLQVNVENLGGARYVSNADSNTNISPGAPRSARIGFVAAF